MLDNFLLVIFSFSFLAFHNPNTVSRKIQKPTKNNKLLIGKKNVQRTASNLGKLVLTEDNKINS